MFVKEQLLEFPPASFTLPHRGTISATWIVTDAGKAVRFDIGIRYPNRQRKFLGSIYKSPNLPWTAKHCDRHPTKEDQWSDLGNFLNWMNAIEALASKQHQIDNPITPEIEIVEKEFMYLLTVKHPRTGDEQVLTVKVEDNDAAVVWRASEKEKSDRGLNEYFNIKLVNISQRTPF